MKIIRIKKVLALYSYAFALLLFICEAHDNLDPYIKGEVNIDLQGILVMAFILLVLERFTIYKINNFYAIASLFLVIIIIPALIIHVVTQEFGIGTILFAFTTIFPLIIIKIVMRLGLSLGEKEITIIPSMKGVVIMSISLFAIFFILTYDAFYISSFENIYTQRFKNSTTGMAAYLQIYAGFVFPLITLTLGVYRKNIFYIAISLVAIIYYYGIMAHKSSLVSVILVLLFYWINAKPKINSLNRILLFLTLIIGVILALSIAPFNESIMNWVRFIVVRSIFIPAITYIDYYNVADLIGYTYFQNINLIRNILPVSTTYETMLGWPYLDLILGSYLGYGETTGYNAGAFQTAHIMGGLISVVIVSFIFVMYLAALEGASSHLDRKFKLTLISPFLYTLSNIPFHTFLVSFGGLIVLVIFYLSSLKFRY